MRTLDFHNRIIRVNANTRRDSKNCFHGNGSSERDRKQVLLRVLYSFKSNQLQVGTDLIVGSSTWRKIYKKMEEFLGVSYKLSKSENFEEYMKAIGVGLVTRKIGNAVSPVVKLNLKDGVYTLITTSTFKNHEISFKPGVEFEEETADGRKVTSIVKIEGNKMIQTQKGEVTTTITREFSGDDMKAVFEVGDVVCTRIYERVN